MTAARGLLEEGDAAQAEQAAAMLASAARRVNKGLHNVPTSLSKCH